MDYTTNFLKYPPSSSSLAIRNQTNKTTTTTITVVLVQGFTLDVLPLSKYLSRQKKSHEGNMYGRPSLYRSPLYATIFQRLWKSVYGNFLLH